MGFAFGLSFLLLSLARAGDPPACPTSAHEWAKWRQDTITNLYDPDSLSGNPLALLRACRANPAQAKFFNDPGFQACMAPLLEHGEAYRFVEHVKLERDIVRYRISNGALTLPESTYRDPKFLPFPTMLDELPETRDPAFQALFKGASDLDGSIDAWVKNVQTHRPEFRAISYMSPFSQHFQLVFANPGEDFDQYFHYDIDRVSHQVSPDPLILTIVKRDSKQHALNPPLTYPKDSLGQIAACLTCHRSGAIAIVPKAPFFIQAYGKDPDVIHTLNWIEERARSTSNALPVGLDFRRFGTPIGEISPASRTPEFIRQCGGADLADGEVAILRSAMNCASCHQTPGRANVLNYPLSPLDFKIPLLQGTIATAHMPSPPVPPKLRTPLYQCLMAEYYGGFKDPDLMGAPEPGTLMRSWLAKPCPEMVADRKPRSSGRVPAKGAR